MAAENIVITFDTDTTKLESTIALMEKLGQVDKKTADEFRAASEKYKQSFAGLGDKAAVGLAKLNNEVKNVGANLAKAVVFDKSKEIVKTTNTFISLREQIKRATAETAELANKFGALDSRTIAAAKNAANLREQFSDVQKQIQALNPEAKFTAFSQLGGVLAGAFQTATGALQAFGVESETATKLAQQFQGAINIAAGLNQLTGLKDALTNVKAALGLTTTATVAATTANEALAVSEGAAAVGAEGAAVATKSFTAALLTNPIFLAVTAIAALAGAYLLLKDDVEDTNKQLETKAKIQGEVVKQTDAERIKIGLLISEYNNINTSGERRNEIIDNLNKKYPEFFGNLSEEKDKTEALTKAYEKYIEVSALRAEADILINKIAENNAKVAEDTANGILDNLSGFDKFRIAIVSAFSPGAAAAEKLTLGVENQAEALKKTGKETDTYQKILQGVIDKLNALGLGIESVTNKEGDRVTKLKELSDKEKQLNADRLKEKRDLEFRLRELGIELIADEFEQRRQKLILAFDKEIYTYAEKLEQKKITLEDFNKIFNKLNEKLTADTAEVTRQGLVKQFADEEALRKDQTDKILGVIQEQNLILQTEDLQALNDRIDAKRTALRAQGLDEIQVAKQTAEFINDELRKVNAKKLQGDLDSLQDQLKVQGISATEQTRIEADIQAKKLEINKNGASDILDVEATTAAKRKEIQQDIFSGLETGLAIYSEIASLRQAIADQEISDIERVRDAELKSLDDRFAKNQDDKDRRIIGERQFREQEKKLLLEKEATEKAAQRRINELKHKQDIANRNAKLFEIAIATARNIVEAGNPYLAAAYAILGAAQTAVVLSAPLPQYAKGTLSVKGQSGSGDSVHAMLTPGESVLPVDTTRAYRPSIRAIYNGSIPASEMNKWVSWRLKYPDGNTQPASITHTEIDYDKLAKKIGYEFGWAMRGEKKMKVSNLSELAEMINTANDPRRK